MGASAHICDLSQPDRRTRAWGGRGPAAPAAPPPGGRGARSGLWASALASASRPNAARDAIFGGTATLGQAPFKS